jgi:predicted tellurium resistance membrane protein TerC
MHWLLDPQIWIALVTLTVLEIVLGVDNIIFISILTGKLPASKRQRARTIGLVLAMATRILLLVSLAWMVRLTRPLFTILDHGVSGRDLILIIGGLFLLAKSTHEIHERLEGEEEHGEGGARHASFAFVLTQIAILDIVFSLDSVITAVGMVDRVPVMIAAVVIAVLFMMGFAKAIGDFVERHPTIKMLALSFLLLVGMALIADGFGLHIPKGYIYFAMGFSVFVEMLNIRLRKKRGLPVRLRQAYSEEGGAASKS